MSLKIKNSVKKILEEQDQNRINNIKTKTEIYLTLPRPKVRLNSIDSTRQILILKYQKDQIYTFKSYHRYDFRWFYAMEKISRWTSTIVNIYISFRSETEKMEKYFLIQYVVVAWSAERKKKLCIIGHFIAKNVFI